MPTPLELLLHPVSLIIIGSYLLLMLWETMFPARKLPPVKGWQLRCIVSFAVFFLLTGYLPILLQPLLAPFRLVDASALGVGPGVIIGIILFELAVYGWHWAIHKSDFLWRTVHQMHHSAERVDTLGAFFLHPFDIIGLTVISSICFAVIVGLPPQAITLVILITNFLFIFEHTNIRTPHWLGYIIQRPESHSYHHAKGVHKNNYCDIPLIDMMFGTFYNPKDFEKEVGFYEGASARVVDMLLCRDISSGPADENSGIRSERA
ncbi:MAG TPA: sterol desaturase family protein [Phnomibacter sp.]|nr:sterol desaturase family protein [Phnomibacter sp.]